jgi:hypothetical protein
MSSFHRPLVRALLFACLCIFSGTAYSESVFVKYRGPVSLSGFTCEYPSSSFVHRICYRSEARYVVLLLGNTYYHYCRVPQSVVEAWLGSSSKGRFYNYEIKGRYDCRQGGVPSDG